MCVPLHALKFTKEQMLSPFLPSSSEVLSPLISSLASKMEEYYSVKQKQSLYLPHHLLRKPTLGSELRQCVNRCYGQNSDRQSGSIG